MGSNHANFHIRPFHIYSRAKDSMTAVHRTVRGAVHGALRLHRTSETCCTFFIPGLHFSNFLYIRFQGKVIFMVHFRRRAFVLT